jgi:hypothetical protein
MSSCIQNQPSEELQNVTTEASIQSDSHTDVMQPIRVSFLINAKTEIFKCSLGNFGIIGNNIASFHQ